jgi:hypothetical protein
VEAYDIGANPKARFLPPAAWITGDAEVMAVLGCGLSFELASGETAADQCGPAYAAIPLDRSLAASPGQELRFALDVDWTITDITGQVVETKTLLSSPEAVSFQPLARCCDTGEDQPAVALFWAPEQPGDWTVRFDPVAVRDGDRFHVPYYVRLLVEP